jgi:hypothetical protein
MIPPPLFSCIGISIPPRRENHKFLLVFRINPYTSSAVEASLFRPAPADGTSW